MDDAAGATGRARSLSLAEALAEDTRRLALGVRGSAVTILSDRGVTLGVARSGNDPIAVRARALGWPVRSRSTGGTGVLHLAGDLVWSLVLPRTDPRVGRDYVVAYARLGTGVVAALADLGIDGAWRPARGLSESCCFLGPRGWALEVEGKVVGGAAQHLTPTHLLHQGALAIHLDAGAASELFELPMEVVDAHLGGLERWLGDGPTASARIAERLALRLSAWLSGDLA